MLSFGAVGGEVAVDESLSKALELRRKLKDELEKVERFIDAHHELFGNEHGQKELPFSHIIADDAHQPRKASIQKRSRRLKTIRLADVAEKILLEAGHPMTRGQLVSALEKKNVKLKSSDNARYVGTIMWRNRDRFINFPVSGYWVRSHDLPKHDFKAGETLDEWLSRQQKLLEQSLDLPQP